MLIFYFIFSSAPAASACSKMESVSTSFQCELVTLMESISGSVNISSTSISFSASYNQNNTDGSSWNFKIALSQLREVHLRNFNHRRSALEFFLIDQTNYFINFTKEVEFLLLIYFIHPFHTAIPPTHAFIYFLTHHPNYTFHCMLSLTTFPYQNHAVFFKYIIHPDSKYRLGQDNVVQTTQSLLLFHAPSQLPSTVC